MPRDVLVALEAGEESANHMEQIALDMGNLLSNQLPSLAHRAGELRGAGLVIRMRRGGEVLVDELGLEVSRIALTWKSDTLRGWGAMAVGAADTLSLRERLVLIEPFADDDHFAVREWAWLAVRKHVVADIALAIECLTPWTGRSSPRLRRFAVEATRPRGVWSIHIPQLKSTPELGLPILEPLRADPSRYVQDSVANWINDASKTSPGWAVATCARWQLTRCGETDRICSRALRTVRRTG